MQKPCIEQMVRLRYFHSRDDVLDDAHRTSYKYRCEIEAEVTKELRLFYGPYDLHTKEARYAGFDYRKAAHRSRLAKYPHHSKLFEIMDELRLTDAEIYELCDWHGSLTRKRREEARTGYCIRDTTCDGISDYRFTQATISAPSTVADHNDQNDRALGNMVHSEVSRADIGHAKEECREQDSNEKPSDGTVQRSGIDIDRGRS